jgi:Tol biopolymer transport system component
VTSWTEGGPPHLWIAPTGPGDWERLTESERPDRGLSWSPDGQFLAFDRRPPPSRDIFLYRFEDRQVVPFLTTNATEGYPEFSPDGRWLAYASNESGRWEVYATSFPDRERTITVSRQGGRAPAWSRDGKRLFYYSHPPGPDGRRSMMAVPVRHDPEMSLGQPTALFRLPAGFVALSTRSYDLHPDGRRLLVGVAREQEPSPPITRLNLVHNWFAELNRIAPVD